MLDDDVQRELSRLTDCAWVAAAFAACQRADLAPDIRAAAEELLLRSGLPTDGPADVEFANALVSQLQQAAMLASEGGRSWPEMDPEILQAQGRASRMVAQWLIDAALPQLGLTERMAGDCARFLDVGVGTGHIAATFAARFPALRVTGIDVMAKALSIAAGTVEAGGCPDRVELRQQDIADLDDQDRYDLVWLPVHFISAAAVREALPRIRRALRPGGWLVATTISATRDFPLLFAVIQLSAVINHGCAITRAELLPWMAEAGFADVRPLPAIQLAGALACGRRSDQDKEPRP
jgi:SAM-dependent methyltransferase